MILKNFLAWLENFFCSSYSKTKRNNRTTPNNGPIKIKIQTDTTEYTMATFWRTFHYDGKVSPTS
jgi:hypothetical protein